MKLEAMDRAAPIQAIGNGNGRGQYSSGRAPGPRMSVWCVATVAAVVDGLGVLIHFDGWDSDYDYWARPGVVAQDGVDNGGGGDFESGEFCASGLGHCLRPAGWCAERGVPLNPPRGKIFTFCLH